jgi:sugar phosphate isomerase/epimerase
VHLAYNTNGLAHHRLDDALALLADLGYAGVALTLDVGHLDPLHATSNEIARVAQRCRTLGLAVAVETGARYVLDPRRKHFPTLLEDDAADRKRRVDFLVRCASVAAELGAHVVSTWSGAAPRGVVGDVNAARVGAHEPHVEALWQRLTDGLEATLAATAALPVKLCFEPEPGMFVERPRGYLALRERLLARGVTPPALTLDVGHLLCTNDLPVERAITAAAPHLAHVHLDDIAGGVHEHRMFGEGDLDLPAALRALHDIRYTGLAAVELSRDSHRGAWAAAEALKRLQAARRAR